MEKSKYSSGDGLMITLLQWWVGMMKDIQDSKKNTPVYQQLSFLKVNP
jgi:hypothetical protein